MTARLPTLSILGTLLAIAAIARLAALVLHEPMLAFANQYDMVRTGACVGLYPDLPEGQRDAATPEAPLERYRLGPRNPQACYPGTEAVLAALVVAKNRAAGTSGTAFPALRELGILKLAIAVAAILALAAAFRNFPGASFLHGATALVVLADPVVSLWFQSLYTEFSIFFGIYLVTGALVAGLLRGKLPVWLALLAGAGAVMAAFAKEQFFLLPFALVAVAAPRLWTSSKRAVLVLSAVSISALGWHSAISRPAEVRTANRVDAYLGVVLPASADVSATLAALRLPERCGDLSGSTWYLRRGEDLLAVCPEVAELPGTAFLRLAISEPGTLGRALAKVIPATQNPLLGYLGLVAGKPGATLEGEALWLRSAWGPAFMLLPASWYLGALLLAMAAVFPAAVLWVATPARGGFANAHAFAAYALMLVVIIVYSLGTTVFGDGLSEAARHNLLGSLGLVALVMATTAALAWSGRVGSGMRLSVALAVFAALAAAFAGTHWSLRQPIALGVIDTPVTMQVPREGFALRGWALDPSGVQTIRILSGSQSARIGRDALLPSLALAGVHGGFPGASRSKFEFNVPATWLVDPEIRLKVEVENSQGVVTEIDRRRLRPVQ